LDDGGAALVTKLHHSLTDGIGGVQLAALVVDGGPASPPLGPAPDEPKGQSLSAIGLTLRSFADDLAESAGHARHLARWVPVLVRDAVRHPLMTAQDTIAGARSVARLVAPVNRSASGIFGARRIGRRLATIDVPLADLHAAAEAGGGHLNDAYLAVLTGAVHRYHEQRGSALNKLRVTVPVSVRTAGDAVGGNRITLIRIVLPAHIAEPAERIAEISKIMSKWRHEPALGHTQEIAFGLNLLPRAYLGGVFKRIELLASDVPGIPTVVWLAGAKITGYYAFGPTIGSGVNATLMSYAGMCNIGINIDVDAVDDPEAMLECIRKSVDEVAGIVGAAPGKGIRRGRERKLAT
jgi:diacylglycerol O-acyltransferase / wax synthase